MKKSEMKSVAVALSQAQDVIDALCEVFDDEGETLKTELFLQIYGVRDSTYEKISAMCGIPIYFASNNHIKEKKIGFRTNSEKYRDRLCLEVAFEYLGKVLPWCEIVISKD